MACIMNTPLPTNIPSWQSCCSSSSSFCLVAGHWNGHAHSKRSTDSIIVTKKHISKQTVRRSSKKGLVFAGFGFYADRNVAGIERQADALMKEAASLLVYQDILKKPIAKAFLDLLDAFRKRANRQTILRAYGVFFKQMATDRFFSWQDYILDSILAGEGNPFSIAAASVGNPQSVWSSGIPKSLRLAASSDLESLQKLSISDSTLAGWVADIVQDVKSDWIAATSNIEFCNEGKAYSSFPEKSVSHINGVVETNARYSVQDSAMQKEGMGYTSRNDDITEIDKEMWRRKIRGLEIWSEAVPLLEDYYATHSYGKLASVTVFHWQHDKLVHDRKFLSKRTPNCDFSHQRTHLETLQKNFRRHASRSPAQHVLLCGPTGVGKTQLLMSAVHDFAVKAELRIVSFPSNDLKALQQLLEDLVEHWQLRFVILIDDINIKVGDEHVRILKSALDRSCQDWPSNIILCGTSTHSLGSEDENVSSTNLRRIFGMTMEMKDLNLEEYVACVEELLDCRRKHLPLVKINADDVCSRAKEWVENQNVYTVQDACQFVNSILELQ